MDNIDALGSDPRLQHNWVSRLVAALVDAVLTWVVSLLVWIPLSIFWVLGWFGWLPGLVLPLVWGLVFMLYCAVMEASSGATIGKRLMHLRVVPISGGMSFGRALTRNLSKIYWLLLLIDVVLGIATVGDPRQRYLDRVAGTTVVVGLSEDPVAPYTPHPSPPPVYAPAEGAQAPQPPKEPPKPQECAECGGRLIPSGDGRVQCIRCGKVV
jgi:uncharacterized RDD family membrane protein YckC